MHPLAPRTNLLLQDDLLICMMVRPNAHGPTGATGTVHCKSAVGSHPAKELLSTNEEPLFVPGFVPSLAKAQYSHRALGRVPGKAVPKPLV